jgi:hypothetical protein
MSEHDGRNGHRERVADLFHTASRGTEVDAERYAARVPTLLAEATRRRARTATLPSAVVPLGARWLPALGAVATLLAAVAVWLGPARTATPSIATTDVDRLLLTGSAASEASDDVVLRALTFTPADEGGDDE